MKNEINENEGLIIANVSKSALKFRAYHFASEKIYPVFSFCKKYIKIEIYNKVEKNISTDFAPLMQFTGLTDKNGIEIYQGDILKEWIEDGIEEKGGFYWYGIVRFLNGQWKVLQSNFTYLDYNDMSKLHEDFEILEVVGNIYQNPEFLKRTS